MPRKTIIITGQMRLRLDPIEHDGQQLDARELAEAARQFLRDELGLSRVHLQAPRAGRGEERGGHVVTPHFVYGTFDFPFELPARSRRGGRGARSGPTATIVPVDAPKPSNGAVGSRARPTARPGRPKAATGATKRLKGR
jgi:hypothetical protein